MDDRLHIRTAQNVDLAFTPAGVGDRILAWLIDALLGLGWLIAMVWLLVQTDSTSVTANIVIIVLPLLLYHPLCEILLNGQSLGKMAMKTRVARLDGAQPTIGQYLLRWLLRFVDVSFTNGMVALISITVTENAQRLGDMAAGTTVIKLRRRVRLNEVRFPHIPSDYEPGFPEAAILTDAEVRTIRAVLVKTRLLKGRQARRLAQKAREAVERRLDIESKNTPAIAFLQSIVKDHTALAERHALSIDGNGRTKRQPATASIH